MNYLTCIFIVGLIIIVFFVGFGIGMCFPFLIKKYFNLSESNLNQLNSFKEEYLKEISSIREELKNLDVINEIENLKQKVTSLSKTRDDNRELMTEWLYGNPNGGDISGTS